jgi:hypothetical protein
MIALTDAMAETREPMTVELTEAAWDRLADLLTVATALARREGAPQTHATMLEILSLVRGQTSHSIARVNGLRIATATVEQMQESTDRILDQMREMLGTEGEAAS